MTAVTYGLGAPLRAAAERIDLGPEHPSRAGFVELRTTQQADAVVTAEVRPGAIHRSVEKLFEVRDYRQLLSLANRHDWQASFVGELGATLVCETALGLEPPVRATWLRTLLAEYARVSSHLAFLSAVPDSLVPEPGVSARLRSVRAGLRTLAAAHSGNRVHQMVVRLGGVSLDLPRGWPDTAVALCGEAAAVATEIDALVAAADLPRVAVLDRATAAAYGVTGPAARACGVDLDLRRLRPYLAYEEVTVPVADAPTEGDAVSRLRWWAAEVVATAGLVAEVARRLDTVDGPVGVKLPKVIRVPEGETYVATEAPLGHAGWWLVSRGDKVPWRLKLRTPSFANLSALEAVLPGTPTEAVPLAVASLGYVVGDVAK